MNIRSLNLNYFRLVVSIAICQVAGLIGTVFTISEINTWYATLKKSELNPPGWIFGPVWIFLYLLMGISLYLVWNEEAETKQRREAFGAFYLQLALNVSWSLIFFGMHDTGLALACLFALLSVLAATIYKFYKISKKAGLVLVPYFAWCCFAAFLNYSVWVLN